MKKPIIGITGATGFIGKRLISFLLSKGYTVTAFVFADAKDLPKQVKKIKGDLVKGDGISEFLKNCDVVVHLAARLLPPESEMFKDNVVATHNLVSKAIKIAPRHLIFISTAAVYGKSEGVVFKESDKKMPDTEYGSSKLLAEKLVLYWGIKTGRPVTILRPFNIYGQGNYKGVIFNFYKSLKEKGKVTIYGDGRQKRDFLYVDDFVEAIYKSILARPNAIFNTVSGRNYSVISLVEIFEKVIGKKIKKDFKKKDEEKVDTIKQSTHLARKEIGWKAKTKLLDGVRKTVSWYEENIS